MKNFFTNYDETTNWGMIILISVLIITIIVLTVLLIIKKTNCTTSSGTSSNVPAEGTPEAMQEYAAESSQELSPTTETKLPTVSGTSLPPMTETKLPQVSGTSLPPMTGIPPPVVGLPPHNPMAGLPQNNMVGTIISEAETIHNNKVIKSEGQIKSVVFPEINKAFIHTEARKNYITHEGHKK